MHEFRAVEHPISADEIAEWPPPQQAHWSGRKRGILVGGDGIVKLTEIGFRCATLGDD
ncbi:hypothetical protein [Rhizobium sp. LjRoot258]|uniref:hypothetical protein n=1 Tax=Rhizobium sp. LjRoot258 TaxID=3342299 RepID=UPI003ECDF0AE